MEFLIVFKFRKNWKIKQNFKKYHFQTSNYNNSTDFNNKKSFSFVNSNRGGLQGPKKGAIDIGQGSQLWLDPLWNPVHPLNYCPLYKQENNYK